MIVEIDALPERVGVAVVFELRKLAGVENKGITGLVAEIDHFLATADLIGGIGVGNGGFELIGAFGADVAEAVEEAGGRRGLEVLLVRHDLEGGLIIFAVGENSGGVAKCGDRFRFIFGASRAAIDLRDQVVEVGEAGVGVLGHDPANSAAEQREGRGFGFGMGGENGFVKGDGRRGVAAVLKNPAEIIGGVGV